MGDHTLFTFYQHKTQDDKKQQEIRPWRSTDRSRHHPHLPPHMDDDLQTFFNLFLTLIRINQCVGSSISAAPVSTSGADDHHATLADEFERWRAAIALFEAAGESTTAPPPQNH
jgi:hypothetical protein